MSRDTSRIGIVFLVNSLEFGGAEKHTIQLFNNLDRSRFRLGLVYLKCREHLLHEVSHEQGTIWCARLRKGFDPKGALALRNWLRQFKPEIVVCVNTYPLFYGHLARWLGAGIFRIIEIFHSTELPERDDRKMRLLYRHLFNRTNCIVYVSNIQKRYWEARGIRKDRGFCICNGINTDFYRDTFLEKEKKQLRAKYGFRLEDFVVGICAALRPEKKHEDLLEAIDLLRKSNKSLKCLIIGDGPRRTEIEKLVIEKDLLKDVMITGFQADVRPFIAICDCMILVSHKVETFSISALEAMALGKPLIMSRVGGAEEQIISGLNGFLFERGDIDVLTGHIISMMRGNTLQRMSAIARSRVEEHFDSNKMLESYSSLFCRIINVESIENKKYPNK